MLNNEYIVVDYAVSRDHGPSVGQAYLSKGQEFFRTLPGLQLATNVRVLTADEPFPTIENIVEDMEYRRDDTEAMLRARLFFFEGGRLEGLSAIGLCAQG